jgi:threonylcarbamoyladenosine tRNA methylthiotransferase MtaB
MLKNQKVKFVTLGCKVNQYETQGMREILQKAGVFPLPVSEKETADYVVVNTCTVTAEADKENRYWIRRVRRENPGARIIVTGCGVERNRSEYENLSEVDLVLMNHEKVQIADRLNVGCASQEVQNEVIEPVSRQQYSALSISETDGFGRAFVKIQDGCNHACSFCKVVMVRGRSRSRNLSEIVAEAVRLRDSGYRELVFAGIQLGAYGLDFESSSTRLPEVLAACAKIEGIERLRLSSIEPTDVGPELIKAMSQISKCCPQMHIPLQSGDDEILKNMNRRYGRNFYRDLIARLRQAMPDFCLSLDVMAGFAGETEDQFQNTANLLSEIKPLKCHVFPYSRREGTKAARLADLPPQLIKERARRLIQLGQELSVEVRAPFLGRQLPVLIESYHSKTQMLQGLTPHYLKVNFPGSEEQIGQIIPVTLLALEGDGFAGDIHQEETVWKY